MSRTLKFLILIGAAPLVFATGCSDATDPGPTAAKMTVVSKPTTVRSRAALEAVVLELQDASGVPVKRAGTKVTAAAFGGATLTGTLIATSDAQGRVNFNDLKLAGLVGKKELYFSATDIPAVVVPIDLTEGAPSVLSIVAGNAQSASIGSPVDVAPAVKAVDADGNVVPNLQVAFGVTAGGGRTSASSVMTNTAGVATLGGWTLGDNPGANSLTSAVPSATSVAPVVFTATATPATTIDINFCATLPSWFGYQDGTSAWRKGTPINGKYQIKIGTRGAIAFAMASSSYAETTVIYGSPTELASLPCFFPSSVMGSRTLRGAINGSATYDETQVVMGNASTWMLGDNPYTLYGAPDAAADLIAVRSGSDRLPKSMIIRRGVTPPADGNLATLDFSSAEAKTPASARLTVTGSALGSWDAWGWFETGKNNMTTQLFDLYDVPAGQVGTYYGVPSAMLAANDRHVTIVWASAPLGSRIARIASKEIADRTVALGPQITTPIVSTRANTPYYRPGIQLQSQAAYNAFVDVSWSASSRSVEVMMLAGYAATVPATWDVSVPDLTAASYNATWGLPVGSAPTPQVFVGNAAPFDDRMDVTQLFAIWSSYGSAAKRIGIQGKVLPARR